MKKRYIFLLALITLLGFWLRFNSVFETAIYNGDEGRDYLNAYRIWNGKLTLLGPAISTVRFFLPPTWYYLVSIPLKIGGWKIEAALLFINLLYAAGTVIYYLLGKEATNKEIGGIISAALFTFSPYMTKAGRFTGNHIVIPVFTAAYLLFLVRYWENKRKKDLLLSSILLGFTFSFHFSMYLFVIIQMGFLLYYWLKQKIINWQEYILNNISLFFFWLPILIFDLRHGFINVKGFWYYMNEGRTDQLRETVGQGAWSVKNNLQVVADIFQQYFRIGEIWPWIYLILGIIGLFLVIKKNDKKVIVLRILGIIFLFFINVLIYNGYIAYHFFFVIVPFYFLLISIGLSKIIKSYIFLTIFLLIITPFSLISKQAYAKKPKRVLKVKKVSNIIINDLKNSPEKKYSIFLKKKEDFWALAKEYKYLVEIKTNKELVSDHHYENAEVLYVVSEIEAPNPMDYANIELENFNPKEIVWEKEVDDYKIYKLKN